MAGWLKLHRSITSSDVFKNPNVLKFWIWALCKASHVDAEQLVGFQKVLLQRGQFIFGRDKAAQELRMNSSSVYKYLKFFENEKMLSVKSNNKFSVVTIVNWDFYQGDAVQEEQQNNNKITTKKQQNNTNKNVKNVKNKENIYPPTPLTEFSPSVQKVIADWLTYKKERNETYKPKGMEMLMKRFRDNVKQYGDDAVVELVENSISSNWQGIIWDRLGVSKIGVNYGTYQKDVSTRNRRADEKKLDFTKGHWGSGKV